MNNHKLIRLNVWLAQEFGRNDEGCQKVKWIHTKDLVRFRKNDSTPTGVILVTPQFERISWAESPLGHCWILALWHEPMGEAEWNAEFRNQFPYFKNGTYYPIFGSQLPSGVEPNDEWTQLRIAEFRQQLEKTYEMHVREGQEAADATTRAKDQETQDMVNDAWPAFNGAPGEKCHVSFPTPETQQVKAPISTAE